MDSILLGGGGEVSAKASSVCSCWQKRAFPAFRYTAPNSHYVLPAAKPREFGPVRLANKMHDHKGREFYLAEEGRFELPLQVSPD